jgi:drug/metabolite transporter (DMT)-like permease
MTDRESRLRGIVLMVVAVGVFAIMDALMKHLVTTYTPVQIAFLRAASSLPFVFLSYAATGRLAELRPRRIPLHLIRAVLSIAMLWSFVWALSHMSMANTYAITLSAPLLVVPFSALFLGEKTDGHARSSRDSRESW